MIFGHAHPQILKAIREAIKNATSFSAPTELEVKVAELITKIIPSIEMVRIVSSGIETTMSAIECINTKATPGDGFCKSTDVMIPLIMDQQHH